MTNVLQFPDKSPKSQRVRNELSVLGNNLEICYEAIEEAVQALSEMEEQIKLLENDYNIKLMELVNEVGFAEVTAEEFQYATNIGVGAGSRQFTLTLEDGKIFTFTIDEGEPKE